MSPTGILTPSDAVRTAFAPILKALGPARQALQPGQKDIVAVRPGYHYPATGNPVPAVVVAVTPGTSPVKAADLTQQFGVPVSVIDATVEEQVAAQQKAAGPVSFALPQDLAASAFEKLLTGADVTEFGPPKKGDYEPMEPSKLTLIDETMKATICVSPEAGWSELKTFLSGTSERLTVAMYQFTAPHVFNAIKDAVTPAGRSFELVLHPRPEKPAHAGVKAKELNEVDQILKPLAQVMKDRFKQSWATLNSRATPDGLWASAYHIKVAVRDGEATWLSSGNWQSSNQAPFEPIVNHNEKLPPGFQRKYNRDYHAVIENEKLASCYEAYIKRDYDQTSKAGQAESFAIPEVFVPEEEAPEPVEFAAPPQFFPPLRLNRRVKVQPLLTPDNYAENALKLIRSAKESIRFQNQYINFRGTGEDFNEFRLLVSALKEKIDANVKVSIICRDMMKQESLDVLIALDFPRAAFRFQPACHNKTIIVDDKVAMFGSHNWSNEGVSTNRDASLIFFDEEIAKYLSEIYDYDWDRLATAKPTASHPRVAHEGEPTPKGHKRVLLSAIVDD
jgi:hypothetical protein